MSQPVTTKGKRKYSIFLEAEKADYVKAQLETVGLSLSGMLRIQIDQLYRTYKTIEKEGSLEFGIAECLRIMSESLKQASESSKRIEDTKKP